MMKHMNPVLRGGLVVAVLLAAVGCISMLRGSSLFASSSGTVASPENATPKNTADLAAVVNGVPITIAELDPQVDTQLRSYKRYGVDKKNDELVKSLRRQALDGLIAAELIYQEAKKLELDDLDERVRKQMETLKEQAAGGHDFDQKQAEQNFRKTILVEEYLAKQDLKDPELPEAVVKDFYEKSKSGFIRKESASTRHILVKVAANASVDEKAAARAKIEKARQLVLDGEPFSEVAKANSECNSAPGGGELGFNERGYMPPAFDEVAFSQKIGELSAIVETSFGFHVIEVLERKSGGVAPYEEIKDFLAKYLKKQYAKDKMVGHVKSLKERAKVEIYL